MHPLVARLRGTLLPAVVTPMDSDGVVAYDALTAYAGALTAESIGGVAVWAHTGRGLYLSPADRSKVLETWRQATDVPIVAGVGVPRCCVGCSLQEAADATVAMAMDAAAGGADAVMVYPLAALGELPDGHAQAVALHERVAAESGLPLVGFYLHGEAGGYPYPPALIRELLSLDSMLGVKTATLDRAIGCQDAIWAGRGTGKLLITGEDRMYGPSFMWGADTALVGIAAAQVSLSAAVLRRLDVRGPQWLPDGVRPAGPVRGRDLLRADRGLRPAHALGGRMGRPVPAEAPTTLTARRCRRASATW